MDIIKIQYLIIVVILLIVALAIVKSRKKEFKVDSNRLVNYLGGRDNIIECSANKSRFIVTVKDVKKVNKEAIQKMGAQGIVEIENQLKIILKEGAHQLKKYIDDLNK